MLRSHSDGEEDQEGHSGKHLRLSMVLGDAELEFFDTIELVASLSYLLQVNPPLCLSCRLQSS